MYGYCLVNSTTLFHPVGPNELAFNAENYMTDLCQIWYPSDQHFYKLQAVKKWHSLFGLPYTLCLKKKTFQTFSTVTWKPLIKFWQFLVGIFLIQLAVKWPFSFPPHLTFVSALPGENTTSKISVFLSNAIWLLNITHKKHFVYFLALWPTFHPVVHFSTACSIIA